MEVWGVQENHGVLREAQWCKYLWVCLEEWLHQTVLVGATGSGKRFVYTEE